MADGPIEAEILTLLHCILNETKALREELATRERTRCEEVQSRALREADDKERLRRSYGID